MALDSNSFKVQEDMPGQVNVYFIYSLEDRVAQRFGPPFVSINDRTAARTAHQMIRDTPTPQDYSLWKLGTFDILSGVISVDTDPDQIMLFGKTKPQEVSNA